MSAITLEFIENYMRDSFLRNNPSVIAGIVVVYLLFIYYVGPWYMKNRPAYSLKKVLIYYNLLQVIWCGALLLMYFRDVYSVDFTCKVELNTKNYERLVGLGQNYFYMKVFDLSDTVFFVLRKKKNQVTYLHVYHHVGMVLGSFYGLFYEPSPKLSFMISVNLFVHFLMYGYYLLTAYIKDHQKMIWWKKYITQLQLFQFIMIFLVYGQMLFRENCNFSATLYIIMFTQDFYMIYLFGHFYYNNYIKKKKLNK